MKSSVQLNKLANDNPITVHETETLGPEDASLAVLKNNSGPSKERPVEGSYKRALLKPIVCPKNEGRPEQVKQKNGDLPTRSTGTGNPKAKKLPNHPSVPGKPERVKQKAGELPARLSGTGNPQTQRIPNNHPSAPASSSARMRIPNNPVFFIRKGKKQGWIVKSVAPQIDQQSPSGKFGNEVVDPNQRKAEKVLEVHLPEENQPKQELNKASGEVVDNVPEPTSDLTSLVEKIPVGGVSESREKTVQKSDQLLKREEESSLESSSNKKSKNKKSKSQVSNDEIGKKFMMMNNAERKLKEKVSRDREKAAEKNSKLTFSDIFQELKKMDIQPSAALDRQKIIYNNFYTAFHPGSQLRKQYEHAIEHASDPTKKAILENKFKDELANPFKEDEIYPGLKRPDAKYDNEKTVDFRLAGPIGVSSKGSSSSSNGGKGKDESAKENMSLG
ncbi:hypothetical protein PCANC_11497 [Puccinia coronata f. sp. avenae]|uniref:Uncharacterized protein n=1 Tax=Puccinia coronata f. sp. avenae TaxID=200324 RepID=A0A2N5UVK9_9BASI|nr:hypothetical protein PCANC_11497 [Puccinia coronata f. sp. avenae]